MGQLGPGSRVGQLGVSSPPPLSPFNDIRLASKMPSFIGANVPPLGVGGLMDENFNPTPPPDLMRALHEALGMKDDAVNSILSSLSDFAGKSYDTIPEGPIPGRQAAGEVEDLGSSMDEEAPAVEGSNFFDFLGEHLYGNRRSMYEAAVAEDMPTSPVSPDTWDLGRYFTSGQDEDISDVRPRWPAWLLENIDPDSSAEEAPAVEDAQIVEDASGAPAPSTTTSSEAQISGAPASAPAVEGVSMLEKDLIGQPIPELLNLARGDHVWTAQPHPGQRLSSNIKSSPKVKEPAAKEAPSTLSRIVDNIRTDPSTQLALLGVGGKALGGYFDNRAQRKADKRTRGDVAESNLVNALSAGKIRPSVVPHQGHSKIGGLLNFGADLADTTRGGMEAAAAREAAASATAFDQGKDIEAAQLARETANWNWWRDTQELNIKQQDADTRETAAGAKAAAAGGPDKKIAAELREMKINAKTIEQTFDRIRDLHDKGRFWETGQFSIDMDVPFLRGLPGADLQARLEAANNALVGTIQGVFGQERLTQLDLELIIETMKGRKNTKEQLIGAHETIMGILNRAIKNTEDEIAGIGSSEGVGGGMEDLSDQEISKLALEGDEAAVAIFNERGL